MPEGSQYHPADRTGKRCVSFTLLTAESARAGGETFAIALQVDHLKHKSTHSIEELFVHH